MTILAALILGFFVISAHGGLEKDIVDDIKSQQSHVDRIVSLVQRDFKYKAYNFLANFSDTFPRRVSGAQQLEDSIDYVIKYFKDNGIAFTEGEEVTVPDWRRNEEEAWIVYPEWRIMDIMALGSSIGTQEYENDTLEAEVLVVKSFDELTERKDEVSGKIVVYNQEWTGYGSTVRYRHGAVMASEYGAVASITKSVADFSLYTPHTGQQDYNETRAKKIPAACITIEDAELLQRYQDAGFKPKIRIRLTCENHPNTTSRNVVAEIKGSENEEQIVLFGGHIDNWDVGSGVMDDGGGCAISIMALLIIKELGLQPRRTMRCVLWTAEEEGLIGAYQYHERHKGDKDDMIWMSESDSGIFEPVGIRFSGSGLAKAYLEEIMRLLDPIGPYGVEDNPSHPDLGMWDDEIPKGSLDIKNENYFWYHHTHADALTMLDRDHLDISTIIWTTAMFAVANIRDPLPRDGDISMATVSTSSHMITTLSLAIIVSVLLHRQRR